MLEGAGVEIWSSSCSGRIPTLKITQCLDTTMKRALETCQHDRRVFSMLYIMHEIRGGADCCNTSERFLLLPAPPKAAHC